MKADFSAGEVRGDARWGGAAEERSSSILPSHQLFGLVYGAALAVVLHNATDDPVNSDPAADVRATVGTLVSLPKQLCHQRWVVTAPMMDDSDKFCLTSPHNFWILEFHNKD
ncbi:unnamed protein product [Pleuronectes platessa]|uniref:Uncharacterized protein n=1 Tax=Pleuronectes platessa TaxID=8262 RepID=A0A9N7Z436_PLEPL|nr:unnamed protein product [Pleuronectes platessa]